MRSTDHIPVHQVHHHQQVPTNHVNDMQAARNEIQAAM
jgi:hypothetical protein